MQQFGCDTVFASRDIVNVGFSFERPMVSRSAGVGRRNESTTARDTSLATRRTLWRMIMIVAAIVIAGSATFTHLSSEVSTGDYANQSPTKSRERTPERRKRSGRLA
jgi:hypothetical protein